MAFLIYLKSKLKLNQSNYNKLKELKESLKYS